MVAPALEGLDLFKIAGRSISGWMKSFKTGTPSHVLSAGENGIIRWVCKHASVGKDPSRTPRTSRGEQNKKHRRSTDEKSYCFSLYQP